MKLYYFISGVHIKQNKKILYQPYFYLANKISFYGIPAKCICKNLITAAIMYDHRFPHFPCMEAPGNQFVPYCILPFLILKFHKPFLL